MRARILNCLGVQFPLLFAEFVASAFPHNQQLIHERNKLWALVDWHCISQLDRTYWRRVVYTGEIVKRGCTSNGHVLHSDASCYRERSRSRMAKVITVNNNSPFLASLKLFPFLKALYSIHRCKNAYRRGSTQRHGCQEETMSSDSSVKFHFSDH